MFQRALPIATALLALSAPCLAEALPLPVSRDVDAREFEFDLEDSRLTISVEEEATPRIEIGDLLGGEDTEGFAIVVEEAGVLRVARAYGDEDNAPRLSITLTVPPSAKVGIVGRRLDVQIEDRRAELDETQRELILEEAGLERTQVRTRSGFAGWLIIEPEDSDVLLSGVLGGTLRGSSNRYVLDGCRGTFVADVDGGSVSVARHWGSLHLEGVDADFTVEGGDQALRYRLTGGTLTTTGAMGAFGGDSSEASLLLEQWDGNASIRGSGNLIEVRSSGHEEAELTVFGDENEIRLGAVDGTCRVQMSGGTLEADDLTGELSVRGDAGARATLKRLGRTLDLQLSEGSYAEAEEVSDLVVIQLQDSELTLDDAAGLRGRASESTLRVSDVSGRLQLDLRSCLLDLDLSAAEYMSPKLEITGVSQARIALRDPCQVKLSAGSADEVNVSGCELLEQGSRRPYTRRVRPPGRMLTLDVELDDGSDLEVWSK